MISLIWCGPDKPKLINFLNTKLKINENNVKHKLKINEFKNWNLSDKSDGV